MLKLRGQGRFRDAVPLAEQALAIRRAALGEKHPDSASSIMWLGVLLEEAGDNATARPYYEQALAIRSEVLGPEHSDMAVSLNNLGYLCKTTGDYAGARTYFEQALAIRRETLGYKHRDTAQTLHNLGTLYDSLGDYATARADYEQALAIRREVLGDKHPDTAATLNNLGFLLQATGDYAGARPYFEQALAINQQVFGEKHPSTAVSLNNIGYLLGETGNYAAARPYYEQALAIRRKILGENHPDTAVSLSNLGFLHSAMGDPAAARACYEKSLAIKERVYGANHPEVAISLNNVGATLEATGDFAEARTRFERALAIRQAAFGERHPATAASLSQLGALLSVVGDYAAARPCFDRALATRRELLGPDHRDTALSHATLAALDAATDEWESAVRQMDVARRIVRRHVSRVLPGLSEPEQLNFLRQRDSGLLHASLSFGIDQGQRPEIAARSATWLLNGKAVAQESLAQRAILARESRDPAMASTATELLGVRRRLAAAALAAPKPGHERDRRRTLDDLDRREQELARRLAPAGGAPTADPWVELDAVRAALPADGALVDIVRFYPYDFRAQGRQQKWQAPRYVAWISPPAGKENVKVVDLGDAATIDAAVDAARDALAEAMGWAHDGLIVRAGEAEAEAALRKPLAELSRLALLPLVAELGGATKLALSPDGALWLAPWSALPLADGRYAVETYEFEFLVSGRDLARGAVGASAAAPVIMANPNYDLGASETALATQAVLRGVKPPDDAGAPALSSDSSALPKVPPLPGTAKEAQAIAPQLAAYAGAAPKLYTEQYALEGVFKALVRPKALVLSTHGYFLADQQAGQRDPSGQLAGSRPRSAALAVDGKPIENPLLRCGLLLAGCNSRAGSVGVDDGILTGMEIVSTDLRGTELVVLSACETGLGKVQHGEGVAGLRQAFQLAGARSVVATLWQVPDNQSTRLMSGFFDHLAAGQSKAAALRSAQLALIHERRAKRGAAHPYFWAAYTVTGE